MWTIDSMLCIGCQWKYITLSISSLKMKNFSNFLNPESRKVKFGVLIEFVA